MNKYYLANVLIKFCLAICFIMIGWELKDQNIVLAILFAFFILAGLYIIHEVNYVIRYYDDAVIYAAFIKEFNIIIEKVYNKSLTEVVKSYKELTGNDTKISG